MRTCLPALLAITLLSACDNNSSTSDTQTHSHDNVSGVNEGVWPPEPIGMEDEQELPVQLRPRARQSVVDIARRSVMNNPILLGAIGVNADNGGNYATFDASLSESKGDNVVSFIFYNYDTNQTVEAILGSDGTVSVPPPRPASEWQPTENAVEVEQAISLARASLEADAYPIDTLEGTAMLTYPTQASTGTAAPMFYDTRMLYVTFGTGDGEPPLYSARVDLSAQVVSEGGPVQ